MSDEIAEIEERHKLADLFRGNPGMLCPQTHDDRGVLLAEVERLRADAERFRWLAAQTRMQIVTDGTVWHHGGGRESFVGWGYMYVNGRGYPAAPSLAELVDIARKDQEKSNG